MKNQVFLSFLWGLLVLVCSCADEEPGGGIVVDYSSNRQVSIGAEAGAVYTLSFTAADSWSASADADWLQVSPQSGGSGRQQVTLSVLKPNDTGEARKAVVKLASGESSVSIDVRQEEYIFVEEPLITHDAYGGNLDIYFRTTLPQGKFAVYTQSDCDWITSQPDTRAASEATYYLPLYVLPNERRQARTTVVYFGKVSSEQDPLTEKNLLATATITQVGQGTGESIDYSMDKAVELLQPHTQGNGIPLVLMGDGFIDREIDNGYYGQVMNQAVENLFTEEPIRSLQDYFDIYSVTAVSRHNIFAEGYETALSCWMEGGNSTLVGGDDLAVQEYASAVDGIDLNNTQIVVVLNTDAYGGTNYSYVDNRGNPVDFSIAYCPVIDELGSEDFRRVMVHEVVGHGIGKLDDEYSYVTQGAMPASEIADRQQQQRDYGWWMNVDFTSNQSAVLWSDFLSDSRYADQGLGVFEGACTYWTGAYRSTEESMMRSNIMGFNAPSRRAIYNNVLQRGESYTPSLEEFIAFDQQTFVPQTRAAETPSRPFARPRVLTLERLSGE